MNAMGVFEYMINSIDSIVDTKRKRNILGGMLLSTSLFFGGLALTVLSLKG